VLGTAVETHLLALIEFEPELGGDDHLVPDRRQRSADEFLIDEGAIDLGRIEEIDAHVHCRAKQRRHLLRILGRAIGKTHPHAAEPEGRDFQVAVSEFSFLHLFFSLELIRRRIVRR
jgi:hypothetical protein